MNDPNQQEAVQKVAELMKGARTCMFTTKSGQELMSRPMALQQVEFDGDAWFFTSKGSDKITEIAIDPEVNIAFENNNAWVSLSGTAQAVDNQAKIQELWNPLLKAWFPEGSEDPSIVLIKVSAESAEYWDSENRLVTLFTMAKAALTGKRAEPGKNESVGLS